MTRTESSVKADTCGTLFSPSVTARVPRRKSRCNSFNFINLALNTNILNLPKSGSDVEET